jgi:hypothetical protein
LWFSLQQKFTTPTGNNSPLGGGGGHPQIHRQQGDLISLLFKQGKLVEVVEFQVITAVEINVAIFWDIVPCNLHLTLYFGVTYHLQNVWSHTDYTTMYPRRWQHWLKFYGKCIVDFIKRLKFCFPYSRSQALSSRRTAPWQKLEAVEREVTRAQSRVRADVVTVLALPDINPTCEGLEDTTLMSIMADSSHHRHAALIQILIRHFVRSEDYIWKFLSSQNCIISLLLIHFKIWYDFL